MNDRSFTKHADRRAAGQGKPGAASAITRGDTLVEKLAGDIAASVFPPGSRLDEVTLAMRYGVSRTPVREALRQLESTGLIERRPFRGAIVSLPSPDTLADLFVAASEIEAVCARLAALAMTAGERGTLRKAHDTISEVARTAKREAYDAANTAFHELIFAGAHNVTMAGLARDSRRRLAPFRRAQFEDGDRIAASYGEHEEIVRAIERGNGEEAASLMRHHIRRNEGAPASIAKG